MKSLLISTVLSLSILISCKTKLENPEVIIVMQSKMEMNTTNSIKILFKNMKASDSIFVHQENGLKFNASPNLMINKHESTGIEYLEYYNYITPTKTGKITLPLIECVSNGKILTVPKRKITVVEHLPIPTSDDVFIEWQVNDNEFGLSDQISLSLYEYSKYYNVTKRTLEKDRMLKLPKAYVEKNTLNLMLQSDVYKLTGNPDLEDYLEEHFDIIDFDTDIFRSESVMEEVNGEMYIKTKLFSIEMKPRHKGHFQLEPSQFVYIPHTSETAYFKMASAKNETNKLLIKSNRISFEVE